MRKPHFSRTAVGSPPASPAEGPVAEGAVEPAAGTDKEPLTAAGRADGEAPAAAGRGGAVRVRWVPNARLALRLWRLDRAATRASLRNLGIPVLAWPTGTELDGVLAPLRKPPPGQGRATSTLAALR